MFKHKPLRPLLAGLLTLACAAPPALVLADSVIGVDSTRERVTGGAREGVMGRGQRAGGALRPAQVFARAKPAVVIVVMEYRGRQLGHGSGFLVRPNGYILTNHHVIDTSDLGDAAHQIEFQVVTDDGRRHTPRIVKADPDLDVALLKIDGEGYPTLPLGDAAAVEVGDPVFVIGTPIRLEFSRSMTDGIVSGINRDQGRIQTSAVIHGGNSGGPALNKRGEVVGIAVAVAAGVKQKKAMVGDELVDLTTQEVYHGVSYLVPINYARNLLNLAF
jgi:S1-C subfamily serine protease